MSKILDKREQIQQPYWATVIRGTPGNYQPITTMQTPVVLFQATNTGNVAITNMDGASAFNSDMVYRILAMRVWVYFRACTGTASYPAAGTITDHMLYHRAMSQMFWELKVASKTEFQAQTPYLPFGGGLYGDVGNDTTVFFNNGLPTQTAIAAMARSVSLPARQGFKLICETLALGAANLVTDINAITSGEVDIKGCIDGVIARDVL